MATLIPANPETWLPKLQAQVMSVTTFPSERVILTLRDAKHVPQPHPQDVLIRVGGFIPHPPHLQGSGRIGAILSRKVVVTVRTRLAVDAGESDEQFITNTTLGHFPLEAKVLNALLHFQPEEAITANLLLQCPLELLGGEDPEKGDEEGSTTLTFRATYEPVLDESFQ